ncbi:MAG TPA: antibiotic biosynthesis monooxygenase [Terriglobales bacterium]|nr:antibiotic biosynthesis monooxygenase [Terriglobales bacterium]
MEIMAMAIFVAREGKEGELFAVVREFYSMLRRKGYSRDLLYRDVKNPRRFIHLRYWKSEETRAEAHEDPDVHRFWQRMGLLCDMESVTERMEELDWQAEAAD